MKKLLIINGPNINMLGIREPKLYGNQSYKNLVEMTGEACHANGMECKFFQSNHEGAIVDKIQAAHEKFDGIIINPAAYTHTSIAILDALKAVGIPAVEVHISDINTREEFRRISYAGLACEKTIAGHGLMGYVEAVAYFAQLFEK